MRSVSILIPTFNSARVLNDCLRSIAVQDYPSDQVEIIIADAGSTDATVQIARQFTQKIFPNPLKTGEAGKAVALKHAKGEIVALIDSDNILPSRDWLQRMLEPFEDSEIIGTEPLEYTHRRSDGYITRYCALIGMNDPLCLFLGNYDRYNWLTRKWTEAQVEEEDKGSYLKIRLQEKSIPTIGANGFLVRRDALLSCDIGDYLFDIDVVYELTLQGHSTFAKVKIGIVHIFSGNISNFLRKQQRRIRDYLYYQRTDLRKYPWGSASKGRLLKFVTYCLLVFPLLGQSSIGYRRKPDPAWFFHPLACWITLWVYGWGRIRGLVRVEIQDRTRWGQ